MRLFLVGPDGKILDQPSVTFRMPGRSPAPSPRARGPVRSSAVSASSLGAKVVDWPRATVQTEGRGEAPQEQEEGGGVDRVPFPAHGLVLESLGLAL